MIGPGLSQLTSAEIHVHLPEHGAATGAEDAHVARVPRPQTGSGYQKPDGQRILKLPGVTRNYTHRMNVWRGKGQTNTVRRPVSQASVSRKFQTKLSQGGQTAKCRAIIEIIAAEVKVQCPEPRESDKAIHQACQTSELTIGKHHAHAFQTRRMLCEDRPEARSGGTCATELQTEAL
jgi:hypothetical protein